MSAVVEPVDTIESRLGRHRHAIELAEALPNRLDERPRVTGTVAFS